MVSWDDPLKESARRNVRRALFGDVSGADEDPLRLGRFELVDKLGEGGMGVVYRARDPSLDREVAIKLLHPTQVAAPRARERILREAHALAKLSHPNVVVVHEVGEEDEQIYLVMEYVDGRTLGSWCRDHQGDWRAVIAKYREAGQGLAVAHEAGLVHRDFKPDNVLVGRDGRVRVLDFGLAAGGNGSGPSTLDSRDSHESPSVALTATGMLVGTPAYMAPEQHSGASVDARADQFAFCLALWEGLFGQRLFDASDLPSLRRALLEDARTPAPRDTTVPKRVIEVLQRGTSMDPSARYPDMPTVLEALDRAVDPAHRVGSRRLLWFGAIAVVGASGVGAWLSRADDPSPRQGEAATPDPPVTDAPVIDANADFVDIPIRRLTSSGGIGVEAADVDPTDDRLVYLSDGYWQRSLTGGIPQSLKLPIAEPRMVLLAPDGGFIVLHSDRASLVTASGEVRDVAFQLPLEGRERPVFPDEFSLSPDGRRLIGRDREEIWLWDLEQPGPPVHLPDPVDDRSALAWSPDGSRIAITTAASEPTLRIIERDGTPVATTPLTTRWSDVGWLPNGALVVLEVERDKLHLRCYHLDEDGLTPGRRSVSVAPASRFHELDRVLPDGSVLLRLTEARNDVAVVDLADEPRATILSEDWDANDTDPVWRADGSLAMVTARFSQRTLVAVADDSAEVTPVVEEPVGSLESDGAGGLIYATYEPTPRLRWIAAAASTPVDLPSPPPTPRVDFACIGPEDCLRVESSARSGSGAAASFFAFDPRHGRLEERFAFPDPDGLHFQRRRWAYARDGRRLLFIDSTQRTVTELDAQTGAALRHYDAPEGTIIQSVRESSDGRHLWLTGMLFDSRTDDTYRLYRYAWDGEPEVVWANGNTWVFGAEPSPDGTRIAMDAMTLHSDYWLADATELCSPAPNP